MEEWRPAPGVIDETVRVAKEFLEANPEEVKKVSKYKKASVGADLISRFLGWSESRVGYSLERLGLTERKVLDKKAVESMPTEKPKPADQKTIGEKQNA